MHYHNKRIKKIIVILLFLGIICFSIFYYYQFIKYEIDSVEYVYNLTSIDGDEENILGTYTLTRILNENNQIEINEIEMFSTYLYSNDELDEVKNHKTYLFDKNFDLISLVEKEYLNGELHLNRFFELKFLDDIVEIYIYKNDEVQEVVYLPNGELKISLASSGIFDLLSLNPKRISYNNLYFTKNIDRYIEQYSLLENTSIYNTFLGDVPCDIVRYSGYLENLLWIDVYGNLLKREKIYDDNFKLVFELVNIN